MFQLIVSKEQLKEHNSYLYGPERNCTWLPGEVSTFKDIISFSITVHDCLTHLEEAGWAVHLGSQYRSNDSLQLDLSNIKKCT